MHNSVDSGLKSVGFAIGYVLSYTIFTTILFLILLLVGKISSFSSYYNVAIFTAAITLVGYLLRAYLK